MSFCILFKLRLLPILSRAIQFEFNFKSFFLLRCLILLMETSENFTFYCFAFASNHSKLCLFTIFRLFYSLLPPHIPPHSYIGTTLSTILQTISKGILRDHTSIKITQSEPDRYKKKLQMLKKKSTYLNGVIRKLFGRERRQIITNTSNIIC